MDKAWLEGELAAGRSIESIAREVGKDSSTVGYWVRKHGLTSTFGDRHAPKGPLSESDLQAMAEQGLSVRAMAAALGRCEATVRHWLKKYEIQTRRARQPRSAEARSSVRRCETHGETEFVRYGVRDHFRCLACRKERVARRRREVKALLVAESGGACVLCGYNRYPGALHFHHRDPAEKSFGLAVGGVARALERCREEARKCVLVCANCHAEVEAGIARLPC